MTDRCDLLVIGAGATGLGCALDAAARGYRVTVVDRGDLATETSSRSTKLVHGGVRYLERAVLRADREQFALVRDALRERAVLRRLAPHLCHRRTLVTPARDARSAAYLWAGLQAYDRLAGRRSFGRSHWIAPDERSRRWPQLAGSGPAVSYTDGAFDDARYAVALATTARDLGAEVRTYHEVETLDLAGDVAVAGIRDRLTGQRSECTARAVINATGPGADAIRRLAHPDAEPRLQPSSGVHLVLPSRCWPHPQGVLVPETSDGRVLFVLPWQGHVLVGTTDEPAQPVFDPQPSAAAIGYLLDHLREILVEAPTREQVGASWSGLRPLVAGGAAATAALSRDHLVLCEGRRLVTIVGGKWTTYRLMARDAVDRAAGAAGLPTRPCRSAHIVLTGGHRDPRAAASWQRGLDAGSRRHLAAAYGDRAPQVAALCRGPDAEALVAGWPYRRGEVRYALRHELARTPDDLLHRRLRLGMLDESAAAACRAVVQAIVDEETGGGPRQ